MAMQSRFFCWMPNVRQSSVNVARALFARWVSAPLPGFVFANRQAEIEALSRTKAPEQQKGCRD
jgi:hypothetical protein